MENFEMPLASPSPIIVEPPPEIEREFSAEFKRARKKFAKMVEGKIQEAADSQRGMDGDKKMNDVRSLVDQMKFLEFMP